MPILDIAQVAPSRKSIKRRIEFNVMVVGETGLGKTTLLNSLLCQDESNLTEELDDYKWPQTMTIQPSTIEIDEPGAKLRLTLIDTPGYGDQLNNDYCIAPIVQYIDKQLQNYYKDETGVNRRNLVDNRVHCLLYFIEPMHRGLKQLDITFMLSVHDKVNIVPLLAKADCYTNSELIEVKRLVRKQILDNKIKIYELPVTDAEDEESFVKLNDEMKGLIPFSVIGAVKSVEIAGKKVKGRTYPWGFINITKVEDVSYCDYSYLKLLLLRTHTNDLRDVTEEIHYENFRTKIISKCPRPSWLSETSETSYRNPLQNGENNYSVDSMGSGK